MDIVVAWFQETGVGESAFSDSEYSVSEDKTPNIHSRQVITNRNVGDIMMLTERPCDNNASHCTWILPIIGTSALFLGKLIPAHSVI